MNTTTLKQATTSIPTSTLEKSSGGKKKNVLKEADVTILNTSTPLNSSSKL